MKALKRMVLFALILSVVILALNVLPSTIAYIISKAAPAVNTFVPDPRTLSEASVSITAQKTVLNTGTQSIGPENFTFVLKNIDTQEEMRAMSDKNGLAVFALHFNGLEAGRYRYTLSEVNNGRAGVTYSDLVYEIDVVVLQDGDQLRISTLLNGTETTNCVAPFENIYAVGRVEPPTGDDFNLWAHLLVMLLSSTMMIVLAHCYRKQQR